MPDALYDEDFYLWTQEQARALRARAGQGANVPVDWENVAEEIESLGRSDRREVASRLATIIEHLLKLEHSPAREPRPSWRATVTRTRGELADVLDDSPSLRRELPTLAEQAATRAAKVVAQELAGHGEVRAVSHIEQLGTSYTPGQLLGDWFPPESDA